MAGREVTISWQGRRARAWVPDDLARRDLSCSEPTARRTEQAVASAMRADDALPPDWQPLVRLLLRSEGLASSFIEGVRAPLTDVVVAELDRSVSEPAAWIAGNLSAVTKAIADARGRPLATAALHRWHRTLMSGASHLPQRLVGRFRDEQGWIGGTSPFDAALVTPPPARIERLVDDLIAFVNRTDVDPVTQAAVAHAQFEVIHPYADGNGRVGRLLVAWILARRLQLATPVPVSVKMARDRGGYLAGLTQFRLGNTDAWVRWFADVVRDAGNATVTLVRDITTLQTQWRDRLASMRTDAAARRVIVLLPERPVCSAQVVAHALGVSERTARTALQDLAERGIVEPFDVSRRDTGRPPRWWVARELIDLVNAWSR